MYDFQEEAGRSPSDSRVVYCPDGVVCNYGGSQECTPDPPSCAFATQGEELAFGAATPHESHQLRMEAVLDKLHKISAPKWSAEYSGGVRSEVLVPQGCTNYIDIHSGAPAAKVSSLKTPPQGLGAANSQMLCSNFEVSAQHKFLLNIASLRDITSSTAPREVCLDDALNHFGVAPYQRSKIAQTRDGLKHANPTASDLCQQETVSAGSIGHPHCCALACKFVVCKTGCRDGSECPNGHLCLQQRTKVALKPNASVDQLPGEATSHGILERNSMSEPMKIELLQSEDFHYETATSSQSGAHLRPYFHNEHKVLKLREHKCTAQESVSTPDCCASVGSLNHPHSCGLPCKYAGKKKGCKDGYFCTRCHVCKWNRYLHSAKADKQACMKIEGLLSEI